MKAGYVKVRNTIYEQIMKLARKHDRRLAIQLWIIGKTCNQDGWDGLRANEVRISPAEIATWLGCNKGNVAHLLSSILEEMGAEKTEPNVYRLPVGMVGFTATATATLIATESQPTLPCISSISLDDRNATATLIATPTATEIREDASEQGAEGHRKNNKNNKNKRIKSTPEVEVISYPPDFLLAFQSWKKLRTDILPLAGSFKKEEQWMASGAGTKGDALRAWGKLLAVRFDGLPVPGESDLARMVQIKAGRVFNLASSSTKLAYPMLSTYLNSEESRDDLEIALKERLNGRGSKTLLPGNAGHEEPIPLLRSTESRGAGLPQVCAR